jgi:hypothetical protein
MSTLVLRGATAGQTAQVMRALATEAPSAPAATATGTATLGAGSTAKIARARLNSPRPSTHTPVRCRAGHQDRASRRACASLHHAAAVAKRDRRHWIYQALLEHLPTSLLCHWNGTTLRGALGLAAGWYAAW